MTFMSAPVCQPRAQLRQGCRPAQRGAAGAVRCSSLPQQQQSRRSALQGAAGLLGAALLSRAAPAVAIEEEHKLLCEPACAEELAAKERVTTASGLQYQDLRVGSGPSPLVGFQYQDLRVGSGPSPLVGFQVVCNYVAMNAQGKVFDSSLDKGSLYNFRFGTGDVIPGLDEGLQQMMKAGRELEVDEGLDEGLKSMKGAVALGAGLRLDEGLKSMKVGGLRRLYIPGELAFPKGVPAAAGRPRVPPLSPVVFDVELLLIPGLDDDEE
ncbi:hypothetical protein N2152v2_002569 [Parachlorella kessleri]